MSLADVFGSVLLIEDEPPARQRLIRMLQTIVPSMRVAGEVGSIAQATRWFRDNATPDLVVCDIQLSDGNALELFHQRAEPLACPVVFCTAHDQFVLESLEAGGLDYLLKPVKQERLQAALLKIANVAKKTVSGPRYLVKRGVRMETISASEVAYFRTVHKMTLLVTHDERSFYIDPSLRTLEDELASHAFIRANRAFLVSRKSVKHFDALPKGRLRLSLSPPTQDDVFVSQPRAAIFRAFMLDG